MGAQVDPSWWTTATWEGQPISEFVRRRDIPAIFRFLNARGFSHHGISNLVGINSNRVGEITRGQRQVTAYDVLERIAVGLEIPRAAMGLGNDDIDTSQEHLPDSMSGFSDKNAVHYSGESGGVTADVTSCRQQLDEALTRSTVSPQQLDSIEESTADHARQYPSNPPNVMLQRLIDECEEVITLSSRRQPARVQARLSGAAALLSTMCADALMRLGNASEARRWYRTAIQAADDSLEVRLSVLVRAHAAMLPYYFGDIRQTITMADSALAIQAPPSSSAALAAAGRARALARLGMDDDARSAMGQARRLFDEAGDTDSSAAFRFPEKRLLFYLSGALTWLRDTKEASKVQDEALTLYRASPGVPIDPALIAMDTAMCLMHDRRVGEAAVVARHAIAGLPQAQRTEIVLTRANDVIDAAPSNHRVREVSVLADYVRSCRAQARTLVTVGTSRDP